MTGDPLLPNNWHDDSRDRATEVSEDSLESSPPDFRERLPLHGTINRYATLASVSTPERRAHASGRYLSRLALTWGALSSIGAIIMMYQTHCEDGYSYGSCDTLFTHPYFRWAIVSLLANLIIASFMYTVGTYIEARMAQELNK